ncbi:MAG TPA: hypothetical protein VKZ79_20450 [Alphaproteobacteria bacterium]|nr:hypothetical protein [Alphaproteobacteria bacterium]
MSKDIVARRYEAARAYHPPMPAPFDFGVDTLSIEELLNAPATCELVSRHAPWVATMADTEAFQPYLSIFTVRDIAHFLPMDLSNSIAALDAGLRSLPRSAWPNDVR